jgi:hypothetical protein
MTRRVRGSSFTSFGGKALLILSTQPGKQSYQAYPGGPVSLSSSSNYLHPPPLYSFDHVLPELCLLLQD